MKRLYIVGTADTKGPELRYLSEKIRGFGHVPVIVDVGTKKPTIAVDISAKIVAEFSADGAESILETDDRGTAITGMAKAFARFIASRDDISGILGIGGGGGTSIICEGMQVLPLGLPKIMVSTLASGDVAPYVGVSDIIMMPSVTDLAGLNRLSRIILHNAASAIVGMSENPAPKTDDKPALGLTMFGVTTPAVTAIADLLADDYDGLIFHATGTGGRAMENLVGNDLLTGVLDITTTEIADLLVGGVLAASETRLDIIIQKALPYVGSVGALDMVNFWAKETVPKGFQNRNLYVHNANVTLMRTDAAECRKIGAWIGDKINKMSGPVRFLIPEKGISSLDIEGGAFFDPATDAVLFDTIENTVSWNNSKIIKRLPYHINDPEFAQAAVAAWREISN